MARRPGKSIDRTTRCAGFVFAAAILLGGCAATPPEPPAEPEPIPAPAPTPIPVVEPVVEPEPGPAVLAEPAAVTVVLSSRNPAYEDVAEALSAHFDSVSIYDLTDKSQPPERAFRLINDTDTTAVVAIGLRAARSSITLAAAPVVFSQVFNYQDHGLIGPTSRGVAAIAPLDAQLSAWKQVDPTLARVGLVIGPGHDDLVTEAEIAAERHGVALDIQVANSDQEALYYFKRMVREIDGFWLLPDNRVLSTRVLREMVTQANRRNVTVLVPNSSMLTIGASISVSTVAADIAARIAEVVDRIHRGGLDDVPAITSLTEIRVETSNAGTRAAAEGAL